MSNKNFKAVVYDRFAGTPLLVVFLGNKWWVVTPGEQVQPLDNYFGNEPIGFSFLCEAGGKVGALALAKMLGKALENPEDNVDEVMRYRVDCLKRLGVTLDVKDEPLLLELETITNDDRPACQSNYSVICHLHSSHFERLFDIDGFDTKHDAEEWTSYYFDLLKDLGVEFKIICE